MERLLRKTTAQQVSEAIVLSIHTGEFKPGDRLPPERKMAAQLGVCRLTLREGLNQLVGRGVLIAVPGLGTWTTSMTTATSVDLAASLYLTEKVKERKWQLIDQFFDTRRMLLGEMLALVCERGSSDSMAWVLSGIDAMIGADSLGRNPAQAMDHEIRVVHLAAEKAGAYFFYLMINAMKDLYRVVKDELFPHLVLGDVTRLGRPLRKLVAERDAAGVRNHVREHYGRRDAVLIERVKAHILGLPAAQSSEQDAQHAETQTEASGDEHRDIPPEPATEDVVREEQETSTTGPALRPTEATSSQTPPPTSPGDDSSSGPPPLPPYDESDFDRIPIAGGERDDPRSWHQWFIDWYRRNHHVAPWENPREQPPGGFFTEPEEEHDKKKE